MARYQLTLAYDGTDFFGSQRQTSTVLSPGASKRTVQGELEKALCKLGWAGHSVILAGRTDTGVHATGQVAAFDLEWSHSDEELLRALNASLPADLAVQQARTVDAKFHPRFDASSRRYGYRLFCRPLRDPLRERFSWRIWPEVDVEILARTAPLFLGTHDFSAFGSPTTPRGSTVRTVMKAVWTAVGNDEWHFEVQADAFLYRMVRRLVFVQVAAAQGKFFPDVISRSLARQVPATPKKNELLAGLAPAHGLTLVEVTYTNNIESMGQ
jgi:tRNA pseudouridine38-40 synthase